MSIKNKRNNWTDNEINILKENYHKGVKFILPLLSNHSKNSIIKKASDLNIIVDIQNLHYDIYEVREVVKTSFSFAEVLRKLDKTKSGDSYKVVKKFIERNNIDYSHFDPWRNNKFSKSLEISIDKWLNKGTSILSSKLKDKLYKNELKERRCELCGQGEEWNGKKMALILDHINGVNNDNRIENLRIVCPNCNATLETFCRGNKK